MKSSNQQAYINYLKEILLFKNGIEKQLENAWEEESNGNEEPLKALYNEPIKISFNGATLELAFGSSEYENLIKCLESIVEEG